MDYPKVILIGGPPLVGKTTLARLLASELQYQCCSLDDLGQAIQAVTTPHSHPPFHYMSSRHYQDYYIARSVVELIVDGERYHEALWPATEALIRIHATHGGPAIIEGWPLQPERIRKLKFDNVAGVWLTTSEDIYEQRLRQDEAFLSGCDDVDKLVHNFVRRSVWYDLYTRKITGVYRLPCIQMHAGSSIEDVLGEIRNALQAPAAQRATG